MAEVEFQIAKLDSELITLNRKIEAAIMDQKPESELEDLYTQAQIVEIDLATEREKLKALAPAVQVAKQLQPQVQPVQQVPIHSTSGATEAKMNQEKQYVRMFAEAADSDSDEIVNDGDNSDSD